VSDDDFARGVGEVLQGELGVAGPFLAFERVRVTEFDFLDVAPVVHPTEVVPLTIKSLLFAGGLDKRSIKGALLEAARAAELDGARAEPARTLTQ
jgi:hypothetical protein